MDDKEKQTNAVREDAKEEEKKSTKPSLGLGLSKEKMAMVNRQEQPVNEQKAIPSLKLGGGEPPQKSEPVVQVQQPAGPAGAKLAFGLDLTKAKSIQQENLSRVDQLKKDQPMKSSERKSINS